MRIGLLVLFFVETALFAKGPEACLTESGGVARMLAEDRAEGVAEVAKAMLQGGVPMDRISRFTGLPKEQIQALP